MYRPLPLAAALAAGCFAILLGPASAQTASYTLSRDACNGDPVTRCLAQNDTPPLSLYATSLPADYAFALVNTQPVAIQVLGFEIWTSSISGVPETAPTRFYRDASGAGATVGTVPAATPVATGTITVGGYNTWWSTSVYPAPIVQPGEVFWVGFFPGSRIAPPMNANASTSPPAPSVQRQSNINNNAWLPLVAPGYPALRVRCTSDTVAVPQLTNLDLPRLGLPFRLQVGTGSPQTPAIVMWSLSASYWSGLPLPFNLSGMGAPDCFVHQGNEYANFLVTDAAGVAVQTVTMPSAAGLAGVTFYHQAALWSSANALNLVTTNLGKAVLGP